ncbi:MAG: hypothetical protein FGM47_04080 [Candidatus Nanopelagicaceae bacterium]|nr:hypothetical protein [Candidatus Nanopelagicaceae bacterium]
MTDLVKRAEGEAVLSRKSANVVMVIALLVYVVMTVLAVANQAWLIVLFCTCILLGVLVVYRFILTVLTHMEIIRTNSKLSA